MYFESALGALNSAVPYDVAGLVLASKIAKASATTTRNMRVVAVSPAPPGLAAAGDPTAMSIPSPMAFFWENELLRVGLAVLNTLLAAYCTAILMLMYSQPSCIEAAYASFYCDPTAGTTNFGSTIRRVHIVLGLYFFSTAWLLTRPRRWVVQLNTLVFGGAGVALMAFGFQQCLEKDQGLLPVAVGTHLILLGVACVALGSVGGWKYDKRLVLSTRVFVDFLISTMAS